jgi:hypothetical protein
MVVKETDHQNFCDTHLIASKYLLQRPTVLGKNVEPYHIARNLDLLISAFFSVDHNHLEASSKVIDAQSSTRLLLEYISYTEEKSLKGFVLSKHFNKFIKQYVVHESFIEGFCDNTYFEKVVQRQTNDFDKLDSLRQSLMA